MAERSNNNIHEYLDGDEGQQDFSPGEVREIAEHETIIRETGRLYRSIEVPDLTARITAQLVNRTASRAAQPAQAGSLVRRISAWLWDPRPVRIRPAYAALPVTAALILLAVLIQTRDPAPQSVTETPRGTVATAQIFVQFRLDAPEASAVHLVGSFTGWKPTYTLHEAAPGIWSIVVPLEPGVHDYAFLVNGQWINDPVAPVVDDGFGGANSRLLVVIPDASSRL